MHTTNTTLSNPKRANFVAQTWFPHTLPAPARRHAQQNWVPSHFRTRRAAPGPAASPGAARPRRRPQTAPWAAPAPRKSRASRAGAACSRSALRSARARDARVVTLWRVRRPTHNKQDPRLRCSHPGAPAGRTSPRRRPAPTARRGRPPARHHTRRCACSNSGDTWTCMTNAPCKLLHCLHPPNPRG